MSTTAEQMRAWTGPAILTYGFRPFFLGAAIWAACAMMVWVPMLSGHVTLPTAFDPVSWHAHEFLFGYVTAVVAGFLLTAVPNWTGRLPIVGWPLGLLFLLWLSGRVVVAFSMTINPVLVAIIDLAMPVALGTVIAREIIAGKNWRNLIVLGMLGVLAIGNAVFHWEAASGYYAAHGYGLRIGLAAVLMMIAVIGGRIIPSFTRNWLAKQGAGRLPVPPMQTFDKTALILLLVTLLIWMVLPHHPVTAVALGLTGLAHVVRLARWAGDRTITEPLVAILHVGYAFLPLGALALSASILLPTGAQAAALHLWMGGAIGLMTLAVMTRATLGHTGQPLAANAGTLVIYGAIVLAVFARFAAGIFIAQSDGLHVVAGIAWVCAFGGFAAVYGPLLLQQSAKNAGG